MDLPSAIDPDDWFEFTGNIEFGDVSGALQLLAVILEQMAEGACIEDMILYVKLAAEHAAA